MFIVSDKHPCDSDSANISSVGPGGMSAPDSTGYKRTQTFYKKTTVNSMSRWWWHATDFRACVVIADRIKNGYHSCNHA